MATVKELIKQLNEIEDKDQPVIFQYYLAEHFWLDDDQPTAEQFNKAADDLDDASLWDDAAETINDYLCGLMFAEKGDN